jgi:predicted GIY-YIG superfamily endonuclease
MTLNEVRSELGKRLGASVTKEQLSTDRIVRQKLVTNCDQLEAAVNDGAEMPANVVAPDQVMRDAQKKRGVDAIDENEYFVYILRRTDDPTLNDTYIGQTKQPEARLDEHNEKRRKGKGAKCTRGRLWTHHAVIGGFGSKRDSLRFEAQLHQGQYDSYLDAAEAAEELMKTWEGLFWEKRG